MGSFKMGVEIPVFLIIFSTMLGAPVTLNFIIYRTCEVIMRENEAECAKLGINTTDNATNQLEMRVEPIANYINMTLNTMILIVPCFLCVFVGPWSDKKGRRPILILTLAGFVASNAARTVIAAMPAMNPWFLFLRNVPIFVTGGMPSFITVSFCYIVDVSTVEKRGLRFGIMEGILGIGMVLGMFFSSFLFKFIGYTGVFTVCTALSMLALILTVLYLDETILVKDTDDCKFFSLDGLKEMCHTTFKKRQGFQRFIALACIGSVVIYILADCNNDVEGLLLRAKFNWDLQQTTTYSTMRSIISIVGGFFGVYILHTLLDVPEVVLIIAASLGCAANTYMVAFAEYDLEIYTAAFLRIMTSVIIPMVRSILSKLIPHSEIGNVFAFSMTLEALARTSAEPLYTVVYTNTMNVFPGVFELIPFSFHVLNIFLFIIIAIVKRRSKTVLYLNIDEELGLVQ